MSTAIQKYFTPRTTEEACLLLSSYREEARIVAGGTDLILQLKRGKQSPKYIINIGHIPGQDCIIYSEKDGLTIGAQATIRSIAASPVVQGKFAALSTAAGILGSPQVRNYASIGGNLCNASPSAETMPALMVLGATVRIVRAGGERAVPVEEFITGPGTTVLKPDEIVADLTIPPVPPHSASVYLTQRIRKQLDLAIVGVAVMVTMDGDIVRGVKLALGAVAPTVIRAKAAEAVLAGTRLSDGLLARAAQAAAAESKPIDDCQSGADYKRWMVKLLVARAIRQAVAEVK